MRASWNIVDSYADTLAYKEFHRVLERAVVIGALRGATIQGDYLVRGDVSGPTYDDDELRHQHGVGFLRRTAIDQTSTRAIAGTT